MDSGGGGGGGESLRASSSFIKKGDRQLFKVELRPGETTIVSWKKLLKDANKVNGSSGQLGNPPPAPRPGLESRIAPGQPADLDKDAPPAHRFSAVIEKIERLYTGNNSSDEEDLGDIPDDDQYDTEDSFIDDAELDEYFEVDNSAIKHDGFFVNRGKLERIEPPVQPAQPPKKRRRKDLGKTQGEGDNGRVSNKHLKVGKAAAGKATALFAGNSNAVSHSSDLPEKLPDVANVKNQLGTSDAAPRNKAVDAKLTMETCSAKKVPDIGTSLLSLAESKDLDKQKIANFRCKNPSNKLKAIAGDPSTSHQKYGGKSVSGMQIITTNEHKLSALQGEKKAISERLQAGAGANCSGPMKNQHVQKKDASNIRPKISMLERAIRDLEKIVAESRPPIIDNQEADASSQAVKRRLPREVKQKLAKVARLAANHGKITKELLNRLMSILGHLIQLRTLKRNLKEMISSGLSAKQEKDAKFQHIKKELSEMIKVQVFLPETKAVEPQAGESDDFQDVITQEKGVSRKLSLDADLENKICDLYDLFVDGLDEDAGPQLRKLYAELAKLWPNGLMDNHGIKQAIYKARERRRALYSKQKEQEKINRKKILATKSEETVRAEAGPVVQSHIQERLATNAGDQDLCSVPGDGTVVLAINATNPVTSATASVGMSSSSTDGASLGRLKQEMSKGGLENMRVSDDTLLKKKVKRKPEVELGRAHVRPEKSSTFMGEERQKSQKQATGLPHRISPQQASGRDF